MSKVTVKIYGQEYTISGDKSEEEIRNIAAHVDEQMKAVGKMTSDTSAGSLAVLASINIGEELFETRRELGKAMNENQKLQSDNAYYMNMWEKSKKATQQDRDVSSELRDRIKDDAEKMQKLREKCNEYESSFFDLQMENIKLKNELDRIKANYK